MMIALTSLSVGIGVGYKLASPPTVTKSNTYCDVFAKDTSHQWKKDMIMERTMKNAKCTTISCPVFDAKTKICSLLKRECKYLS